MRKFLFLLFNLIWLLSTGSPPLSLKFNTISTKQGLSNNKINDILQDHTGFIWVATDDGLNRYDGNQIKVFQFSDTVEKSISHTIHCLLNTKKKEFIVGGQNGIHRYNGALDKFEFLILENIHVKRIIQGTSDNNLYIATTSGLYIYSNDFKFLAHYDEDNSIFSTNLLQDLAEDKIGNIWIAAGSFGIYKLRKDKKISVYRLLKPSNKVIESHYLLIRRNGAILASMPGEGIIKFNTEKDRFEPNSCKNCTEEISRTTRMYEDSENRLWVCGGEGGLALYNAKDDSFIRYKHQESIGSSINDNVITSIYYDNQGGLWVGSFFEGINFANLYNSKFHHLENFESNKGGHNIVCSILEDKKSDLWISTDGGIIHCDKDYRFISSHNTLDKPFNGTTGTLHMSFDENENIWGGSYLSGAHFFNTYNGRVKLYKHNPNDDSSIASDIVWYTFVDSKNQVWFGTSEGISRYDPQNDAFINFNKFNSPIENGNTRVIFEDVKGNYWFGTEDGLYKYNEEEKFIKYTHAQDDSKSICNNWIITINEDKDHTIWFGSYGGGISRYNPETDDFTSWDEQDGLANDFVCSIISDDTNLWISTFKGLSFFDVKKNKFKNYHSEDGLQGEDFYINSYLKTTNGRFLFGGINGLTSFNPKEIKLDEQPPKIVFTDFKVQNESVNFNDKNALFEKHISYLDEVILPYDYSAFTVQFSALNYTQSNKTQYAYRLNGFDEKWNYVGSKREATYTNLTSGDYVFELKVSNDNVIWTKDSLKLNITITTPFYRTWWFKVILICLIILLLFFIYKIRVRKILSQKRVLKKIVIERTKMIQRKNKELEEKNEMFLESLSYVQFIQNASLPELHDKDQFVKEFGVLYLPRQIVSGNFYWMEEVDDKLIIVAVDCTDRGVSSAFIRLIGHGKLSEVVKIDKVHSPEKILEKLDQMFQSPNPENGGNEEIAIGIVVIDKRLKIMEFSGALIPLIYIQNNELTVIKGDNYSIWSQKQDATKNFIKHTIDLSLATTFYLCSDGYQDQLGGIDSSKDSVIEKKDFSSSRLQQILFDLHDKPMKEQIEILKEHHIIWKGNQEQTDDIIILGGAVDYF